MKYKVCLYPGSGAELYSTEVEARDPEDALVQASMEIPCVFFTVERADAEGVTDELNEDPEYTYLDRTEYDGGCGYLYITNAVVLPVQEEPDHENEFDLNLDEPTFSIERVIDGKSHKLELTANEFEAAFHAYISLIVQYDVKDEFLQNPDLDIPKNINIKELIGKIVESFIDEYDNSDERWDLYQHILCRCIREALED